MRWSSIIVFVIVVFLGIFNSCKLGDKGKDFSEGTMKYNITYLEDENENPIISLMPSKLNMSFKNNSVIMEVEGWMGVFKSSFIKNSFKNEAITLLKMLNKKICFRDTGSTSFLGFDGYNNAAITFDDKTKKILDFTCKHASVTIVDKNLSFDIYYTEEIKIDKPNEFTPYANVPGVLMEFQIEINGIPMYLIVSEVVKREISNDIFNVPTGYEDVPREELEKIFSSLI